MRLPLVFALLIFGLGLARGEEVVLYRQVFGNDKEGNADITMINWEHFFSGEPQPYCVAGVPGQPQDLPNVNTVQPAKSIENGLLSCAAPTDGYYFARPAASERIAFIKADLDPSHYKSLSFRWYSACHTENQTQRLAIMVGNKWYVSDFPFQNVAGWAPFTEKAVQATVDFTADKGAWRELISEPGNKFRVAEQTLTENIPAGAIKNFGIFCENPGGPPQTSSAVDTFEVVGVK